MKDDFIPPTIGRVPMEYDHRFLERILRSFADALDNLRRPGPLHSTTLNLSNLPTSATGLRTGDVWNDTGTLKVV